MTMNEMNDIRDMSHSKSERKQKRPILKLFINKFSPISLQMGNYINIMGILWEYYGNIM